MRNLLFTVASTSGALAFGLVFFACHRDADERLGLDDKRAAQEVDVASIARSGELEKALSTPAIELAKKLGTYRLLQTARLTMAAGEHKDTLEETWKLEVGVKGSLHVVHETSGNDGFETYAVGDSIYVRPRYGRFVRRPVEGDELERTRQSAQDVLAGYLSVLGRFADRKDDGITVFAGRTARKLTLTLNDSPSRLRDSEPGHQWRKSMKVSALRGEVVVDAASGAPLHAVLDATYTAPRTDGDDQRPYDLVVTLSYRGDVEAISAVGELGPPPDAAPPPIRTRPILDKQVLLDGLVTPPSAPSPPGSATGGN